MLFNYTLEMFDFPPVIMSFVLRLSRKLKFVFALLNRRAFECNLKINNFALFSAPSIYDCTFENGTCTWTQALDDKFNWTRAQGKTSSLFTGPGTDHTTGGSTGYYIYIETSAPRKANDTARIESATIPATQLKCLQFWYHMYGPHVDTLNVYTKANKQLGSPVWTLSGTQGNKWRHAVVSLTVSSKFQVKVPLSVTLYRDAVFSLSLQVY